MDTNFTQISCLQFQEKLKESSYILIDLRTAEELQKYGIIQEKQIHIDVYTPEATSKILNLNKKTKYLLYCWHGIRSAQVRSFMQQNNFETVCDLKGGIEQWNNYKKI